MAKARREKRGGPTPPSELRVLPTPLRIGDRLPDESGEWQVLAGPYTTAGGKTVNVRVQQADNPNRRGDPGVGSARARDGASELTRPFASPAAIPRRIPTSGVQD